MFLSRHVSFSCSGLRIFLKHRWFWSHMEVPFSCLMWQITGAGCIVGAQSYRVWGWETAPPSHYHGSKCGQSGISVTACRRNVILLKMATVSIFFTAHMSNTEVNPLNIFIKISSNKVMTFQASVSFIYVLPAVLQICSKDSVFVFYNLQNASHLLSWKQLNGLKKA